jgi:hypothetical protein
MLKYFMNTPNSVFKNSSMLVLVICYYLVYYNEEGWGSKPCDVSIVDAGL